MKLQLPKSSTPILLVCLGLLVTFVMLVYLPLSRSIAAAHDSLELKQSLVSQEGSLLAQIERHAQELEDVKNYTQSWEEVPNANFYLSQMLGEISQHAKQAGTDALRLEPGQATEMQAVQRIPVRLGCTGTFQEIHDLIGRIENLPYKIWLRRVELAPKSDQQRDLTCEMEFEAFIVSVKNSH
ncbi:type 4a pilus biogenesis protein PilO [Bremerella sp. P1]|uniref:type 4a pilus biogenesis protein PilO n=1 Tax=Bremerella sp. P1 TaxID=3026424 RepID=UPI0023685286|nr:type 4a pilus biogenesis protein PilO [Bremerella sp. P1]WDI42483.1 type 4a pilus biogenesis protein PilO [Bremerella sp. P1]